MLEYIYINKYEMNRDSIQREVKVECFGEKDEKRKKRVSTKVKNTSERLEMKTGDEGKG